jgi:hypothetical protein
MNILLCLAMIAEVSPLACTTCGDCTVFLVSAEIGDVPLQNPITGAKHASDEKHLLLLLLVANNSDKKKIDYDGGGSNLFSSHGTLSDDLGNFYKPLRFGIDEVMVQKKRESIYPGKSVSDLYVFEVPVDKAKTLTLTIEGKAIEQTEDAKLTFPWPPPKPLPAPGPQASVAKPRKKSAAAAQQIRTWRDATGQHSIDAEYRGMTGTIVSLKKRDGTILKVPLERLSDEDQEWIKRRSRR